MSTNSHSVIHDICKALAKNPCTNKDRFECFPRGNEMLVEYDGKTYDITVTEMCPSCGEEMDFGQAVNCLKQGFKVARSGWNGKGMYLCLASDIEFHTDAEIGPEREATVSPCIVMKTAKGDFQPGWLASQADMLSEDWTIVE